MAPCPREKFRPGRARSGNISHWLTQRLRTGLQDRQQQHLLRQLRPVPADCLDLASNDYLGLARHPRVVEAAAEAARSYGSGARASRLISGDTPLHHELEHQLAHLKGTPAALVLPSGFQANLAVLAALAGPGTTFFCHRRSHASVVDGCRLAQSLGTGVRYFANTQRLHALLRQSDGPRVVVTDGVFSMDGDLAPIAQLLELAHEFQAALVLDEAHATGVLGPDGSGLLAHAGAAWQEHIILVGTLSKALAAQGGFLCASSELVQWLVNSGRAFIYSTGLNPAACGAALQALALVREEPERRQRLRDLTCLLAHELAAMGWQVQPQETPILPVLVGEAGRALELSARLLEEGVWCPAIRPPTVRPGTSRLRLSLCATLTDLQLQTVVRAFAAVR